MGEELTTKSLGRAVPDSTNDPCLASGAGGMKAEKAAEA